ncbi:MAG TPA: universal stress protein [Streptosporangiaceae bacterium]|jgi:nucleotide-binding universal stress UspA family protein
MSGVVVGTDGSAGARKALAWAVEEARLRGAPLTVLAVVTVPVTLARASSPLIGEPEPADLRAAEEEARTEIAEVDTGGVDAKIHVVSGVPAEELVNAGRDADLLVVGSRGVGGFSRLLLGSVSTQVVHHARCPVVVVPHDERG